MPAWKTHTAHVTRMENVLLEVRELTDRVSWRVTDGNDGSPTGEMVASGSAADVQEAQGQCQDAAIEFLDQVSPR